MQAKIMLLPANSKGKTLCSYAEELFLEISASFGHSLNTFREKIGEDSVRMFDIPLTQETLESCKRCQAVFLADADCEGSRILYQGLGISLRIRSFVIPDCVSDRHLPAQAFLMGQATSLDSDTIFSAARQACLTASGMEIPFCHISPTGNSRYQWEAHIRETLKKYPSLSWSSLTAPDAIRRIIETPRQLGFMLCPPYAGSILESAATSLFPLPGLQYDWGTCEQIGVYAPRLSLDDRDIPEPFGAAFAIAAMLRHSLRLQREAACLEAAIHNVLSSGWRTAGMVSPGQVTDGSHIIQLICEQLAVAGEFVSKGGR